ncbi:unnamed protein product [Protopolystoma xenopodis]|uniref:Reverse transcriptase domain-containing protein n=1 Tax=Protopolystoma xenopodis TaxID=117903 RepID=A0A448WC97_9PLAT|nr:unnamed protein product [Protopolystoma xenopodis]
MEETELLSIFDVQYTYTNISREKALKALLDSFDRQEDISEADAQEGVVNTTNQFDNKDNLLHIQRQQTFGLPVGSPLSSLMANVYMNKLKDNFKTSLLQPEVLMRYLDDYFAL